MLVRDSFVINGKIHAGIFYNLTLKEAEGLLENGYKIYFGDELVTKIRVVNINGSFYDNQGKPLRDLVNDEKVHGRINVQIDNNVITSTVSFE